MTAPTPREEWCDACDDPQGCQRWSRDHDAWFCVKCWNRINAAPDDQAAQR